MSVLAPPLELQDERALTREVLAHLDAQIASAQRLLETVLEQGAAIRARDVHTVVRLAGMLHGEMSRRQAIEVRALAPARALRRRALGSPRRRLPSHASRR